jgi:mono/diheme cytochrome c family protein
MYRPSFFVPFFLFAIFASSPNHARAQQDGKGVAEAHVAPGTRAKEIYRRDCLVCHGPNGDGKTDILRDRELNLPDWTDPKSLGGPAAVQQHPLRQR